MCPAYRKTFSKGRTFFFFTSYKNYFFKCNTCMMYVEKKYIYSFSEKLFNIIQYSWWLQTEINSTSQPLYSFSFYAIMVIDTLNTICPLLLFFSILGTCSIKGLKGPLSPSDLKKYIYVQVYQKLQNGAFICKDATSIHKILWTGAGLKLLWLCENSSTGHFKISVCLFSLYMQVTLAL